MSDRSLRHRLDDLLAAPVKMPEPLGRGPVVLYGAGAKGRESLSILRSRGHDVAAFVDRAGPGQVAGVDSLAPDDPAVARLAADGCPALVTVFNPGADPLPIHASLLNVGFQRVIGMVEGRQCQVSNDAYWLSTTATMTPPEGEAIWLFDKLADDVSRHTLLEAIALRCSCDPAFLRSPTPHDQYFPAGVPLPRAGVRFVDGGAFDGDTIANLMAAGFTFDAIAAFEPDPTNYVALGRRIQSGAPCGEVSFWPCGLDETPRQVRFRADGLASSGLAADGDMVIQTVSLDAALPRFRPTYVKLDIEGAEAAALRGMAASIRTARPALAVCLYHAPADLWTIPRLVESLLPDAAWFLRSHAWNGFELVLYAVPKEQVTA